MTQKRKSKLPKANNIKSDAFFKAVMENGIAAREFLEQYLPVKIRKIIDLSKIKVEKESYVEGDLKRKLSDVVYSVKTKTNDQAFVYVLIEHQSNPDYWIAIRLWKYMLLLCERHKNNQNNKLPLVIPIVFYNGKKTYNVPTSLWELFEDPLNAKELMTSDYKLVDLQAMSDEDIYKKDHIGMMEYFMKHIHVRDQYKIWEEGFKRLERAILIDSRNGYVYIKLLLWYTDTRVPEAKKESLNKFIVDNLPKNGEEAMISIADSYVREGYYKGRAEGIEKGIEEVALQMLAHKSDINFVSKVTGLPFETLNKMNSKISLTND